MYYMISFQQLDLLCLVMLQFFQLLLFCRNKKECAACVAMLAKYTSPVPTTLVSLSVQFGVETVLSAFHSGTEMQCSGK